MKALCLPSVLEVDYHENTGVVLPKHQSLHVQVFLLAKARTATTKVERMRERSPNTHGHARASSGVTKVNRLPCR